MRNMRNILISALTAVAFVAMGIVLTSRSTRLQAKISVLEGRNQELERAYRRLETEAGNIRDSLKAREEAISRLAERDSSLARQNRNLEREIEKTKSKYEKARNRAAGFDADSIRRFFSELQ